MKINQPQKNISSEWQQVKLGDIGRVSMCKRIFKEQTLSHGEIPFYKIGTFGSIPDAFISKDLFVTYKNKYAYPKKGDILISASGTIGRTVVFDGEESYFQDSNIVWIANPENKVLNKFLEYVYKKTKWTSTDGGIISRLYNENLRSIKFLLPPLPEQNRIVSVLETWDKAIEKISKKIELKKQIKKGLMQDLLTGNKRLKGLSNKWEVKKLGDVSVIKKGDSITKKDVTEGNVPVIAGGQQPAYYHNQSNRIGKTITVSASGAYAGYIDYYNQPIFVSDCTSIKEKDVDIDFIYLYLKLKQQYIYSLQSGGAQPHVQPKDLQIIKIEFPKSKDEQSAIAKIINTADNEIQELEKKLQIIKDQKCYLLNNLITGTIRTPENLSINT
jgi:type I restriction enzyme S subunit